MDGGTILLILLALVAGGFALAIGTVGYSNRAKHYVLRVRPYPWLSQSTRMLTDKEWDTVAKAVKLVELPDQELQGMPIVAREDLEKACAALGLEVDDYWSTRVQGVNGVALRYPKEENATTSVPTAGKTGSDAAITRGARAESAKQHELHLSQGGATDAKTGGETPSSKTEKDAKPDSTTSSERRTPTYTSRPREKEESTGFFNSFGGREDGPFRQHQFSPRAEILKPPRTPKVLISPDAYKNMLLYVEFAPKEVGWLGTVKALESGDFLIDMVYLLEQEVTAVETELSTEGQNKLQMEFKKKHGFMKSIEMGDALKFWGHSHVRMEVFPSGTDESTMVRKGNDGIEWYIRGIFNKFGKAKFDLYRFDRNYRILDVPWQVVDPETGKVILVDEPKGMWGGVFTRWQPPATKSVEVKASGPAKASEPVKNEKADQSDQSGQTNKAKPDSAAASIKPEEADSQEVKTTPTEPTKEKADADATESGDSSAVDLDKATPEVEVKKPHMFDSLPEVLRPSEELRAAVRKEYDEKVDERTFRATLWKSTFESTGHNAKSDLIDDRWVGDTAPGSAPQKPAADKADGASEAKPNTTSPSPATASDLPESKIVLWLKNWFSDMFGSGAPKPPVEKKRPVYPTHSYTVPKVTVETKSEQPEKETKDDGADRKSD